MKTTVILSIIGTLTMGSVSVEAAHEHRAACDDAGSCQYLPELEGQLDDARARLASAQTTLDDLHGEREKVERCIADVRCELKRITRKLGRVNSEVKGLEDQRCELRRTLADLQRRQERLSRLLEPCGNERASRRERFRRGAQVRRVRHQLRRVHRAIKETTRSICRIEERIEHECKKRQKLERRIAKRQRVLDGHCARLARLDKRIDVCTGAVSYTHLTLPTKA